MYHHSFRLFHPCRGFVRNKPWGVYDPHIRAHSKPPHFGRTFTTSHRYTSPMIIFYDIPSTLPGIAWSPNTWKVRFALNYKNIPYKTEWVEYPDIEPHCISLSIRPTNKKEDGSDHYTLPAIWDTATDTKVSDSLAIIDYLEKTYPDRPTLFPDNTKGLHLAFQIAMMPTGLNALRPFIIPAEADKLNPRSKEYFYRTRSATFGKPLQDIVPTGEAREKEWGKFKAAVTIISDWYAHTDHDGPFLMGDKLGWADLVVGSFMIWVKVVWENDPEWKDVASWNEGRWEKFMEALEPYSKVQ